MIKLGETGQNNHFKYLRYLQRSGPFEQMGLDSYA